MTDARPAARDLRRRRHRARLDDRRGRLRGLRAGRRGGRQPCCSSAWRSRPASPTATPSHRPSWPRSTRRRAAPTSTAASASATWWGFLAGWGFVIGKTASCAAMALTFAAYAVPGPVAAPAAAGRGAGADGGQLPRHHPDGRPDAACSSPSSLVARRRGRRRPWAATHAAARAPPARRPRRRSTALQSAGLLFFAFAGYARIATLGEEVRDPGRTIPRAIPMALGSRLPSTRRRRSSVLARGSARTRSPPASTPLATRGPAVGAGLGRPLVDVGAAVASLGALLALIAGIGRTTLAMAREGDLPRWLPPSTRATACRTTPSSPSRSR